MSKLKDFKVGTDPELFLIDTKTNIVKSAIGIIGGTKDKPTDIGNDCALQEDNVMAEFCVPPATSAGDLHNSIQYALNFIKDKVKNLNLDIHIVPSAVFSPEELNNPQAQMFG